MRWTYWFSQPGAAWPADCSRSATRVLCRAIDPTKRLYLMTRHFVWLTPLVNLLVFVCLGLCLAGLTKILAPPWSMAEPAVICALAILPMLIVAGPPIYPEARLVLALGIASRLVPWLVDEPANLRRRLAWSFPGLLGLVIILAGSVHVGDWFKQRLRSRPSSAAGRFAQRALDRARHGTGRPIEPLWISSFHDPDTRASGQTRYSLRRRACCRTLDPHVARQLLQRPLAP